MNDAHLELLTSPYWHRYLAGDLLPWALDQLDGDRGLVDVLEVGPGPGLMTDLLRARVQRLVSVEIDADLARALAARLAGVDHVEVVCADATATDLATDRFSSAVCFTMLHHVPSPALQDDLFAEVHRVLRPGGRLVGVDSVDTPELRAFHKGDTFVPVDLAGLGDRLEGVGFGDVVVDAWVAPTRPGPKVRFTATKPTGG